MQKQRDRAQIEAKKNFLRGYEDAKRDVHAIQLMIQELRDENMRVTAVSYTNADMPKSPNHGEGDLSEYAAELDELEKRLKRALAVAWSRRNEIYRTLEYHKSAREKEILVLRYIRSLSWKEVADAAGYQSDSRAREIHEAALEHLEWQAETGEKRRKSAEIGGNCATEV